MKDLEIGIKHEQEHRESLEKLIKDSKLVDTIIENNAKDHLEDMPDYYEKLDRMEHGDDENKKKSLAIALIEGKDD